MLFFGRAYFPSGEALQVRLLLFFFFPCPFPARRFRPTRLPARRGQRPSCRGRGDAWLPRLDLGYEPAPRTAARPGAGGAAGPALRAPGRGSGSRQGRPDVFPRVPPAPGSRAGPGSSCRAGSQRSKRLVSSSGRAGGCPVQLCSPEQRWLPALWCWLPLRAARFGASLGSVRASQRDPAAGTLWATRQEAKRNVFTCTATGEKPLGNSSI